MDDLNRKKSSTTSIVAIIILALLLGFGAYTFTKQKMSAPEAPAVETTEATPPAETTPAPATEPEKPVVVETKKLPLAATDEPAPSSASTDPAIVAMMAPRMVGNAAAPVKITEYSSLTCPHCGAFHRETYEKFKAEFIDTGKVQLTFKEFPLNQPAMDASQILRCMPADKYVSFMSLLWQEQEKWAYDPKYKDILRQNAKLAGMSDETFDACLANTALKEAILGDMKTAGDKYKVQSTPSFVFQPGGKVLVGNQPIEEFAKEVTAAESGTPNTMATPPATVPDEPVAPSSKELAPAATPETKTESAPAAAAGAAVDASGAASEDKTDSTDEETPPAE